MTDRIVVYEREDGAFERLRPGMTVTRIYRTAVQTTSYADGRREEIEIAVEPYEVEERFVALGDPSPEEMADRRLVEVEPFTAPGGKRIVGDERFERGDDGMVRQLFEVEDIPKSEPPQPPEPDTRTPEEKLADAAGLTVEELRSVIEGGGRQ